jgi:hypothetical protein
MLCQILKLNARQNSGGVTVSLGKKKSLVLVGFIVIVVLAIASIELNQVSFFEE